MTENETEGLVVLRNGLFNCQVCVPGDWGKDKIIKEAEYRNPCGTTNGWSMVEDGNECLAGSPSRVTCNDDPKRVHVVLEA